MDGALSVGLSRTRGIRVSGAGGGAMPGMLLHKDDRLFHGLQGKEWISFFGTRRGLIRSLMRLASRSPSRSRSEAGGDYCMDTNLRARLLHLDVRALSMLNVEEAFSQAQDRSQHLQFYSQQSMQFQ